VAVLIFPPWSLAESGIKKPSTVDEGLMDMERLPENYPSDTTSMTDMGAAEQQDVYTYGDDPIQPVR